MSNERASAVHVSANVHGKGRFADMTEKRAIFPSGASSSELAPRYDLLPPGVLDRECARWAMGAAIHGPDNWKLGAADEQWRRDRANHLLAHALAYVSGDRSEDHLSAIRVNAGMLQYADQQSAGYGRPGED